MHGLERRYLLLPGLRSSNVHVYDTQPDPRSPHAASRRSTPKELADGAGYSRPHTLHCGPDGIFLSCLGGANGDDGPGGIALLDHATFDVLRAWETDRGPQYLAYDAWWHLNQNVAITSEWGTPSMVEDGLVPGAAAGPEVRPRAALLGPRRGPAPADRRPRRAAPDGAGAAAVARPRGDVGVRRRRRLHRGPVGVGLALAPRRRHVGRGQGHHDPGRARRPGRLLPPALQPFGAVPPLVTDINLSVDDRMLYVSCWGTGELKQYDVSDPAHPREVGSVRLGGIVGRAAHPAAPDERLAGGPQMVEVSRDGRRVYMTNSLYGAWDDQFYPARRRRVDGEDRRRSGGRDDRRRAVLPARRRLPRAAARTRCGCRAATPRRTRTATDSAPWQAASLTGEHRGGRGVDRPHRGHRRRQQRPDQHHRADRHEQPDRHRQVAATPTPPAVSHHSTRARPRPSGTPTTSAGRTVAGEPRRPACHAPASAWRRAPPAPPGRGGADGPRRAASAPVPAPATAISTRRGARGRKSNSARLRTSSGTPDGWTCRPRRQLGGSGRPDPGRRGPRP